MPDYIIGWFVWTNKLFEAYRFKNLVEEKEIVDARLSIETRTFTKSGSKHWFQFGYK